VSGDGYKTLVGQAAREEWLCGSHPFGRSGVVHFSYFRKQKIVRGVCARRRVALRGDGKRKGGVLKKKKPYYK
tara:strand:+ start:1504 stop:1722 length:219 start_codon:yes stop_codon:yes gene_type:complete